jgi:hypothetical protein
MTVAAYVQTFVIKAPMTRVGGVLRVDNTLGEEGQSL